MLEIKIEGNFNKNKTFISNIFQKFIDKEL